LIWIQVKNNSKTEDSSNEKTKNQLKAAFISKMPLMFEKVKSFSDQVCSIVQTYQNRKDYQVTQYGIECLISLVYRYISIKNGAFFPSSIIPKFDHSHDDFLQNALEKLKSIHQTASTNKDIEISKQVIECFSKMAIVCSEIQYIADIKEECHHCMLAAAYLEQSIQESVKVGLYDIGIIGSDELKNIGLNLIVKGDNTSICMIFGYLSKIAMQGLLRPDSNYLISNPIKALSNLLGASLASDKIDYRIVPKTILDEVRNIICLYVKSENSNNTIAVQFTLGDFVDMTMVSALPYQFSYLYNIIINLNTPKKEKNHFLSVMLNFGEDAWRFYNEISKCAAEKECFLIHYIGTNLEYIVEIFLALYQQIDIGDREKKEILKVIGRIISNYWRIYDYHREITKNYESQILEQLLRIGYKLNELSLYRNLNEVIKIIVSIGNSYFKKQKKRNGYDPIRIIEKAAYLCILNGSDIVYKILIESLKNGFWAEFKKQYPELINLIFDELLEVDIDYLRLNRFDKGIEDIVLSKLTHKGIKDFVSRLRKDLE